MALRQIEKNVKYIGWWGFILDFDFYVCRLYHYWMFIAQKKNWRLKQYVEYAPLLYSIQLCFNIVHPLISISLYRDHSLSRGTLSTPPHCVPTNHPVSLPTPCVPTNPLCPYQPPLPLPTTMYPYQPLLPISPLYFAQLFSLLRSTLPYPTLVHRTPFFHTTQINSRPL